MAINQHRNICKILYNAILRTSETNFIRQSSSEAAQIQQKIESNLNDNKMMKNHQKHSVRKKKTLD